MDRSPNIMKPPFISRTYETTESNKTGSWRYRRPRYEDKTSPCSAACPVGEDIARIQMLVSGGLFEEAWQTILMENPFPGVCGRACFHPCEGMCNRESFDSAVAIHAIERFLADMAVQNNVKPTIEKRPQKSQRIAIIGSGPAGLSAAWFLNLLGYHCDIYESLPEAGGIMRWGIPEYRLPSDVLQNEISRIEKLGVSILTGRHVTEAELDTFHKKYDAVFIGCGHSRGLPLDITGETQESVGDGLEFLHGIRNGERPSCHGLTGVIGGGNTAVDIARTAIRLGGKSMILYRRRRQDMPAFHEEITMALEEGVELQELLSPTAVYPEGKRYRLILKKMKIEGQDADGRGKIIPDGEKVCEIIVDHAFAAIGADVSEPWYTPPSHDHRVLNLSHCRIWIKNASPLIYGGDLTNTTKNITQAIASGKQAAMALDTYFLQGLDSIPSRLAECRIGNGDSLSMEVYTGGIRKLRSPHIVRYEEINTDYFQLEQRISHNRLPVDERIVSFHEIEQGLEDGSAEREGGRCFNCGLCNQCDNCYIFCPDIAVIRGRNVESRQINPDYCKGCGLCVAECPRNAVTMEGEGI